MIEDKNNKDHSRNQWNRKKKFFFNKKIIETKSWFFARLNKDKPLARMINKKERRYQLLVSGSREATSL